MMIKIQVVGKGVTSIEEKGLHIIAHDNDLNAVIKSSESHLPNIILLDYNFLKISPLYLSSRYL